MCHAVDTHRLDVSRFLPPFLAMKSPAFYYTATTNLTIFFLLFFFSSYALYSAFECVEWSLVQEISAVISFLWFNLLQAFCQTIFFSLARTFLNGLWNNGIFNAVEQKNLHLCNENIKLTSGHVTLINYSSFAIHIWETLDTWTHF